MWHNSIPMFRAVSKVKPPDGSLPATLGSQVRTSEPASGCQKLPESVSSPTAFGVSTEVGLSAGGETKVTQENEKRLQATDHIDLQPRRRDSTEVIHPTFLPKS